MHSMHETTTRRCPDLHDKPQTRKITQVRKQASERETRSVNSNPQSNALAIELGTQAATRACTSKRGTAHAHASTHIPVSGKRTEHVNWIKAGHERTPRLWVLVGHHLSGQSARMQ
jgi:hypothetical protein